jgi:ribosomal protein S12 methylthiotransferase accessory factor
VTVPGGGPYRTVSAVETVARIRPFLREMGITRVANVTGMDVVGIPTVVVARPNGRSLSVSQGKGPDLDAARASGLMEAVEQHVAERIDRPLRLSSRRALVASGYRVIDVNLLPAGGRACSEDDRILWIDGRTSESAEPVFVPYELVHLDFTLPLPEGSGRFLAGSNGLASGNDTAEATCHGLCEVIERDATTLFYRLPWAAQWQRRLDPDSVDDPLCRGLLDRYERARVNVALWDITSDVGVAAVLCSVLDRHLDVFRPVGIARGFGCHPDPAVATARALCEAAQSRLTRIVGSRDDLRADHFQRVRSEREHARGEAQMAAPTRPPRRWQQLPCDVRRTFADQIGALSQKLADAGVERPIVVDLSPSRYPVRVVRVIAPGLEPSSDAPGYRPGRRALGGGSGRDGVAPRSHNGEVSRWIMSPA